MSDLRLRARSVAEIVDAGFQLYRRDALQYILLSAVAYAPLLVAQLLLIGSTAAIGAGVATGAAASGTQILFGIAFGIAAMVAFAIMMSAITRFSADAYLGRPREIGDVLRDVLPRFWTIIGAAIAYVALMALGFIPIGVASGAGAATGNPLLVLVGFTVGMVLLVYLFARFFAVFQVVILEKAGVVQSFSRSGVLSKGRKGHILLTLLLVWIVFFGMYAAVLIFSVSLKSQVLQTVLLTIFSVIAYPLIGVVQMLLYFDTRIRSEGFDIEMMTGELPPARPAQGVAQ